MSAFQLIITALFALSCLYTVFGYPGRYGALSGRSRLFRTLGLFLLNLLLGLVLLYTYVDFQGRALREVTYLTACLFICLSLLCIALLDWLETLTAYRRAQREIIYKSVSEPDEPADIQDEDSRSSPP